MKKKLIYGYNMANVIFDNVYLRIPVFNQRLFSFKQSSNFSSNLIGGLKKIDQKNLYTEILHNITFEAKNNDSIGIVGHNGCGKTTLLKTISRIFYPTQGKVQTQGIISPFLNIHSVTKPEATGYENIKILWLYFEKKSDLSALIKSVEDFSELSEYLNFPIKTYSAGMLTRLFFAILINIESDIIVIDEGISTGDEKFQKKAQIHLEKYLQDKKIKFFASHDLNFIEKNCNKLFIMKKGSLIVYENVQRGLDFFKNNYYK